MEQYFRNYQVNHKVQEKIERISLLEIEKKESKNFKKSQKLLKYNPEPESSVQSEQVEPEKQRNVYKETDQELGISGNTGTIPK